MSRMEYPVDAALLGGVDPIIALAAITAAFLVVSSLFFVAISIGPYFRPSAMTEAQKNAVIAVGTAIVGLTWMIAILLAAGNF